MTKRSKRLEKGVDSLKRQIENHFNKVEEDIKDNEIYIGRYHIKEIEKSLLFTLERKISIIGFSKENSELIKKYKERLEKLKKEYGIR
ncbi:MAG: hypothetical protein AABW83_01535 [Nanoarchaeota archaeon]